MGMRVIVILIALFGGLVFLRDLDVVSGVEEQRRERFIDFLKSVQKPAKWHVSRDNGDYSLVSSEEGRYIRFEGSDYETVSLYYGVYRTTLRDGGECLRECGGVNAKEWDLLYDNVRRLAESKRTTSVP